MRSDFLQKYLSIILIFFLFVSQTIQVSFFDSTEAATDDYRDIVSIIVDKETYGSLASEIKRYSSDIQSYLGATRVSLFVVPSTVEPRSIAAKNESLYYEGDGKKGSSALVGTILLGNIPLPIVHLDAKSFPSLYPYVDFREKHFVYNDTTRQYEFSKTANEGSDVEIWHGAINPAVGRAWKGKEDIEKIRKFLDKTHDFYQAKGKFAPSTNPPRVFYYDGYNESAALDFRALYQYVLSMKNMENFAYKRFSKYLLSDINTALADYDTKNNTEQNDTLASLGISGGSDSLDSETISKMPDIQTVQPIRSFTKRFFEIINSKVLGDEQLYVHNAGRYTSGATVRIDQGSVLTTLTDEFAARILKEANDALEASITDAIQTKYASNIIVFDRSTVTSIGNPSPNASDNTGSYTQEYKNYYFGTEAASITKAEQCSIARGKPGDQAEFGKSILVEANVGYNVNATQAHAELLKNDTEELVKLHRNANYACFDANSGSAKITSYWGKNSLLRLTSDTTGDASSFLYSDPAGTSFSGFNLPIFSLEGMKETKRLTPLSPTDCTTNRYQYTLLQPYKYTYYQGDYLSSSSCSGNWPNEWNNSGQFCSAMAKTPRFTCVTNQVVDTNIPDLAKSLIEYSTRSCFAGSIFLDGKIISSINNTCIYTYSDAEGAYSYTVDNTRYENRYYHSIPSIVTHISPTPEEYSAAESNSVTPSLPIDEVRSIEFFTPKGNLAKFTYPNFFQAVGSDIPSLRSWLTSLSNQEWNAILSKENVSPASPIVAYLGGKSLPASPFDWNNLISDAVLQKVLQARSWLHPDVTEKYTSIIQSALSYSHIDPTKTSITTPPIIPYQSEGYDIAYLGLSPFATDALGGADGAQKKELQDYQLSLSELEGINLSEEDAKTSPEGGKQSAECGPPDGVPLFQWPSAIMCWMKTLMPPKIMGGSCGGNTIGSSNISRSSVTPPAVLSGALREYYDAAKLVYTTPRSNIARNESTEITFDFITKDNAHIELSPGSMVSLDIVSLESEGKVIPKEQYASYFETAPNISPYADQGARFVGLSKGRLATVQLQATLSIPYEGGGVYTTVSQPLTLRVTDEFLEVHAMVGQSFTGIIDTTLSSNVTLSITPKDASGSTISENRPYMLDIYDDVDNTFVASGIVLPSNSYMLPVDYTKRIGVYKFVVRDASGRTGVATLAVRSGPFEKIVFSPVSSAILYGASSFGFLRLTDRLGNLLSPEFHTIHIEAKGGYILDTDGSKKTSLDLDTMESESSIAFGSDTPGSMTLSFTVDGIKTQTFPIRVLESAKVQLERVGGVPLVGGDPVKVRLRVLDTNNEVVSGFSSFAHLDIPEAAGSFDTDSVRIEAGTSDYFTFIPGRLAGDHTLSLTIPGIGTIPDIVFSTKPGIPMYVSHAITDDMVEWTLLDRYGNLTPASATGTIVRDADPAQMITFTAGKYTMIRNSGYYTIRVPSLESNEIRYSDTQGDHVFHGISYASVFIPKKHIDWKFGTDYNARYSVLAGDSYLREGENILYDTDPGKSQSLAVSTILTSPYAQEVLFQSVPGGGFLLGKSSDTSISATARIEKGVLTLRAFDEVRRKDIAKLAYPLSEVELSICTEADSDGNMCETLSDRPSLRLISLSKNALYTGSIQDGSLLLYRDSTKILSVTKNGVWNFPTSVHLIPNESLSRRHLVLDIMEGDTVVGRILVATDMTKSVVKSDIDRGILTSNTVNMDEKGTNAVRESYDTIFDTARHGYQVYQPSEDATLDETLLGPNSVDSLGALRERSGIGWNGNNRMMLLYSAGDTVGEATRWFQTYTFVNLGDPVAHVDAHAPGTEQEGIDRSIGTQIASSSHGNIASYAHRDMNHDGFEDMIVVYSDGFMELFLNLNGKFRSRGMIASVPDISSRGISLGDFSGDGYGDILGVNNSGSFILIDNSERKLSRTDIQVFSGVNMSIPVPTGISQYKIYDMDTDGRDDIVFLTEGGELGVLYGTKTAGVFEKKILDSTLGVKLSTDPETMGGAALFDRVPKLPSLNAASTGTGSEDESMLRSEVYYQRSVYDITASTALPESMVSPKTVSDIESVMTTTLTDPNTNSTSVTRTDTYVKSEYAPAYGLSIEKHYRNLNSPTIRAGDAIEVDIALTNTSKTPITGLEYLDTIPKIFDTENTTTYRVTLGGESQEKPFEWLATEEYDSHFSVRDIPAGETLHITYQVRALPASYGEMSVGKLEGGEVGDDVYGDVGFKTSTTCGAEMILWRSTAVREYVRGTRSFTAAELPDGVSEKLIDADKNGIPDSVEKMSNAEQKSAYTDVQKSVNSSSMTDSRIVQANVSSDKRVLDIGLSPQASRDIANIAENLANGLSCGFGGGGCMSFPMNWAPLAPGSDPVAFGNPIGDGFKVDEGLPLFSGLTRMDVGVSPFCVTFPVIWPISPFSLNSFKPCNSSNVATAWAEAASVMASGGNKSASFDLGAGGILGTLSSSNFLRIFVTPTLTLGMGTAICMGGPAKIVGGNPGKGLTPLVQGGNCIILTKPMNVCKNDGSSSDGSVRGISGLGSTTEAWNGESCSLQTNTLSKPQDKALTQTIVEYLKNPDTKRVNAIYNTLANRGPRNIEGGPAVSIGGGGGPEASIEIDAKNVFNPGKILKIKNKRIPGFPDFIMDWVSRQGDEITNKLLSLPNLVVIPPKNMGPNASIDGTYGDFLDKFSAQNQQKSLETLKAQVGNTFQKADGTDSFAQKLGASDAAVKQAQKAVTNGTGTFDGPMNTLTQMKADYVNFANKTTRNNASTINKIAGGVGSMKAVSNFLGQIPFLRIEKTSIPVNVPWITPSELDRYSRALKSYQAEIESKKSLWCNGKADAACLDSKTNTQMGGLTSSIEQNLARIEEYKRFPQKLQKYITWKQRYMTQLICNVNMIEQVTVGWMRDNGLRFRKWAEFYVLLKTVVSTWQPMIDIFKNAEARCSVCRNERYDAKYFLFKLISALIPSVPVLQFPRWPNIILNLSDVRLAMSVKVPEFVFNVRPIRLPNLPELGLPGMPGANLALPKLDVIPPLPILPELPDLPSLPRIQFPNLPPPPKLPKLFGSVQAMLKIIDLFLKVRCYVQNTVLVPEWRAGDVIAQRTERQGTLPFDFLKLQFPQFAIPAIKEIGVSSHVNFEMRSEFIAEYAKTAVKPVNSFATDLSRALPSKVGTDVNVSTPSNVNLKLESSTYDQDTLITRIADLHADADIQLTTDEFYSHLRRQMAGAGLDSQKLDRSMRAAKIESEKVSRDFIRTRTESFRLMREYLDAEIADTKELEKMIDRLSENNPILLSNITLPVAQFVSQVPSASDEVQHRYEDFVHTHSESFSDESVGDTEANDLIRSFHGKMSRIADASDSNSVSSVSSTSIPSGYAPNLQGIYILTPSGIQTRLFDYIDPLTGSEATEVLDMDKDGDKDYITLLDGALFVKYSHANEPAKIVDTSIAIQDLDTTLLPNVPNFFLETVAAPGRLRLSFSPATHVDTSFRLEFFDRYIEWDHTAIGIHNESEQPRSIIDFVTNTTPIISDAVSVTPVTRALGSVAGNPSGFILEGQKVSIVNPNERFTLTAGRPIYTGKNASILTYDMNGATGMTLSLKPWTKYTFHSSIAGTIAQGKLYTFQSSLSEKAPYSDDLLGMPLLDGMKLQNTEGAISIYNTVSKEATYIEKNGTYQYLSLGNQSDEYSISVPYENGFYFARLSAIQANGVVSDHAGITLLAPQKSLDTDPPIVDLPDTIRVPVYQKKDFILKDVMTDSSDFSVKIDPNITLDENGDGIYDNDFSPQGTGVSVVSGKISFGPYDTLDPRLMSLEVMDEFGNTTIHPIGIEVYTPTPTFVSFGSDMLSGSLDEALFHEPIDAFRIRPGVPMSRISENPALTRDTGGFTMEAFSGTKGIRLGASGSTTLVDEMTGIPLPDSKLSLQIVPASATSPMRFQYVDTNEVVRFESFLSVPSNTALLTNPRNDAPVPNISIGTMNPYISSLASLSDPGIPGGIYITDTSKNPLIALARDGNIYLLKEGIHLSPRKEGEFLVIDILQGGILIALVEYKIRFFSTITTD